MQILTDLSVNKKMSIPYEICHLMDIKNGYYFNMYCEIENYKIVLDRMP